MSIKYKRILLKLSGEALAGDAKQGINSYVLARISKSIKKCTDLGAEIGIVVGGGNFWRGRTNDHMDRTRADHIGMLATVMNALAMGDALENEGVEVRVQTAIIMQQIAEPYIRGKAVRHMEKGRVVIYGCGTGSPFFSTDTAAALRSMETDCDIIFKATMVDGIYDCDPNTNPNAVKFDSITYNEILSSNLQVMDSTATAMCMDNKMPILVFNLNDPDNIIRALKGETIGTIVKEG